MKVDVNAAKAGDYRMALHYANGPNPFQGPKKMTLIVNGTSRQITLPSTGTWKTWGYYLDTVDAQRRARTRSSSSTTTGDDGNVNLDSLRLAPAGTTRYEAEAATLAGGANAQTEHAGYSGLGYVGGYQNQGASTTFKVTALADGAADVTLGLRERPEPVPGHQAGEPVRQRRLREEARAARTRARGPNYRTLTDKLVAARPAATTSRSATTRATTATSTSTTSTSSRTSRSSAGPSTPNDTFDGTTLDKCRWTTILNEDPAGYSRRRRQAADQGGRR